MRRILLISAVALAGVGGAAAQTGANKLYIVPADESGKVVKNADGSYAGQMEMLQSASDENVYTLAGAEFPYPAFAIYGVSGTTGLYSFYSLPNWAVSPVPANYPSPLTIAGAGAVVKLPEAGTFDFEFYDRDIDGISYHMLVPKPAGESSTARYPSQLYLVDSSDDYALLEGDMTTGVYEGDVKLPEHFRISYEPRYKMEAFLFGPTAAGATDVELADNENVGIAYAEGTGASFSVAPSAKTGETTHVRINLPEGYIVLGEPTPTGLSDLTCGQQEKQYYTLQGTRLPGAPACDGIYIVKQGDRCTKAVVRL